jgi:hypothetical protein
VRCTPKPIVHAHPPDQCSQFRVNLRLASRGAGFPAPVATKSTAMPAHEGLWPNDHHGVEDRRTPTISGMKNRRSLFVNWTRPRTFRRNTISCCLSAAFSASSRLLDLKNEEPRFNREISARPLRPTLSDSVIKSKWTRFSVRTGRAGKAGNSCLDSKLVASGP